MKITRTYSPAQKSGSRLWAVLNSQFTLWFLSSIVLAGISVATSKYLESKRVSEERAIKAAKLDQELRQRLKTLDLHFLSLGVNAELGLQIPAIFALNSSVAADGSAGLSEYKENTFADLLLELGTTVEASQREPISMLLECYNAMRIENAKAKAIAELVSKGWEGNSGSIAERQVMATMTLPAAKWANQQLVTEFLHASNLERWQQPMTIVQTRKLTSVGKLLYEAKQAKEAATPFPAYPYCQSDKVSQTEKQQEEAKCKGKQLVMSRPMVLEMIKKNLRLKDPSLPLSDATELRDIGWNDDLKRARLELALSGAANLCNDRVPFDKFSTIADLLRYFAK